MTDFFDAVRRQDLDDIRSLLRQGVSPDTSDDVGSTALIHAAAGGALASTELLLESGADLHQRNRFRETALSVALSRGHRAVGDTLLARGADAAYAFRLLIETAASDEAIEPLTALLDPVLIEAYGSRNLAVALTSRDDCHRIMAIDPTCVGGVYTEIPDDILMFCLARIPDRIKRLYVGDKPEFLEFLLRSAASFSRENLELIFGTGSSNTSGTRLKISHSPIQPPEVIEIEPIDWCNLRCKMCHVSLMHDHTPSRLSPDSLANFGLERASMVQLGAAYEPMLHKDFATFVAACSSVPLSITTNATLLTPQFSAALRAHGDVTLNVSIDGGTQEVFESIRRNGHFDDLRQRLKELMRARNPENLRVAFYCTVMRTNIKHLRDVVDFAEDIGADCVGFRTVFVRDEAILAESVDDQRIELTEALDAVAKYIIQGKLRIAAENSHFIYTRLRAQYPDNFIGDVAFSDHPAVRLNVRRYSFLQLGKQFRANRCASPERLVRIEANGVVTTCKGFAIGNVYEQPLDAIWSSPAANLVRQIVNTQPQVCAQCDHYRFCLNTGSREAIASSSLSGPLKNQNTLRDGTANNENPAARALYDQLADHRTQDLIKAARLDRPEWARIVLATGLDPEVSSLDGCMPLMVAAEAGAVGVMQVLLNYGISPNSSDGSARPPLAAAAQNRQVATTLLLDGCGADREVALNWLRDAKDEAAAEWLASR